jgi:hypothetical protein
MKTQWYVEKYRQLHWRRLNASYQTMEAAMRKHPAQPGTRYIQIVCHDEDIDKTAYRADIKLKTPIVKKKRTKVKTLRQIREASV